MLNSYFFSAVSHSVSDSMKTVEQVKPNKTFELNNKDRYDSGKSDFFDRLDFFLILFLTVCLV